jgi:hypothetical protein
LQATRISDRVERTKVQNLLMRQAFIDKGYLASIN